MQWYFWCYCHSPPSYACNYSILERCTNKQGAINLNETTPWEEEQDDDDEMVLTRMGNYIYSNVSFLLFYVYHSYAYWISKTYTRAKAPPNHLFPRVHVLLPFLCSSIHSWNHDYTRKTNAYYDYIYYSWWRCNERVQLEKDSTIASEWRFY